MEICFFFYLIVASAESFSLKNNQQTPKVLGASGYLTQKNCLVRMLSHNEDAIVPCLGIMLRNKFSNVDGAVVLTLINCKPYFVNIN